MKKLSSKMLTILILGISVFVVAFCTTGNFSGDAQFIDEGIYPLKNYRIEFPVFPLDNIDTHRYEFKNSRGDKKFSVKMFLESTKDVAYWELDTDMVVEIVDSEGSVVFRKDGPVNSHYQRMWQEGDSFYPLENEWLGFYRYADPLVSSRVVPFSSEEHPLQTKEIKYWSIGKVELQGSKQYVLSVDIVEIPSGQNIGGKIELSSTWK